jgi:hypothetical protein
MAYEPTNDYNVAYEAAGRRLDQNYAKRRAQLNQEIASRGVNTSGVALIPGAELGEQEQNDRADLAGRFALEQAHTGIEDRQAAENFDRNKELARLGYDAQAALSRRLAKGQLQSGLIAGGAAGLSSYFLR